MAASTLREGEQEVFVLRAWSLCGGFNHIAWERSNIRIPRFMTALDSLAIVWRVRQYDLYVGPCSTIRFHLLCRCDRQCRDWVLSI